MSELLLRCEELRVGYLGRAILPPIELEIRAGEFWAVIGRNGSGKTTWLRTLLGLLPPVGGRVTRARAELSFSYVPQQKTIDELYPLLARDVVGLGLERGWSFLAPRFGREPPEILAALEAFGAGELAGQPFRSLSEGQKQRVLFARLAVSRAEIAVLDEPTSAMDPVAIDEAFELLARHREQHALAIVMVSHTVDRLRHYADHALLVDRERETALAGSPEAVFADERFTARFGESARGAPPLRAQGA